MEFSEQYLTYDEYQELGGTLEETPFNLLELEARTNINRETQGRLIGSKKQPAEVKLCMFGLINGMAYDGNYKDVGYAEKTVYINTLIYNTLVSVVYDGTPLLYRGV